MVKHFRDRVDHFEIWNEWNISCYWGAVPNVEHYLAAARAAIPVIHQHAPDAKIMMGSWAGFPHGIHTWSPEQLAAKEKESLILQATRELAREVDEIGFVFEQDARVFLSLFRGNGGGDRVLAIEP